MDLFDVKILYCISPFSASTYAVITSYLLLPISISQDSNGITFKFILLLKKSNL